MFEYIEEIITSWDQACINFDDGFNISSHRQRIVTPAPGNLFKVDESSVKLESGMAKTFHTVVAKALHVSKQARPDISLAIELLTTQVRGPDKDDWRKLRHLVVYLQSTRKLPLLLGAGNTGVLYWYVDASFAVHPNM